MRLILASKSPRRAEIMRQAGFEFEIVESNADESLPKNISPGDAVTLLSKRKAADVLVKLYPSFVSLGKEPPFILNAAPVTKFLDVCVLAADTLVVLNGRTILGKPKDEEDAFNMLVSLCDRRHYVYTGVTLAFLQDIESPDLEDQLDISSFYEETVVYMRAYGKKELREYIKTGEPMDKAGAYAIQGRGATLVEKIDGDYYNVVGLPIAKVHEHLRDYITPPRRIL